MKFPFDGDNTLCRVCDLQDYLIRNVTIVSLIMAETTSTAVISTAAGNYTGATHYAKLDTIDIVTIVLYFVFVVAVGLYVSGFPILDCLCSMFTVQFTVPSSSCY